MGKGAKGRAARGDTQAIGKGKNANRGKRQHPTHNHHHCIGDCVEKRMDRATLVLWQFDHREGEREREDDKRQYIGVRRRTNWVGRHDLFDDFSERLGLLDRGHGCQA